MIPVKIMTRTEAVKKGLADNKLQGHSGKGFFMGGTMIKVNKETGEEEVLERYIDKGGKKELIFMSKKRQEDLKKTEDYDNYIKQFDKISGIQQ